MTTCWTYLLKRYLNFDFIIIFGLEINLINHYFPKLFTFLFINFLLNSISNVFLISWNFKICGRQAQ